MGAAASGVARTVATELLLSALATAGCVACVAAWLGAGEFSVKRPRSVRQRSVAFVLVVSFANFLLARHYIRSRVLVRTGLVKRRWARAGYYAVCACCLLGNCSFVVQYFFANGQHDSTGDPPVVLVNMLRVLGFFLTRAHAARK